MTVFLAFGVFIQTHYLIYTFHKKSSCTTLKYKFSHKSCSRPTIQRLNVWLYDVLHILLQAWLFPLPRRLIDVSCPINCLVFLLMDRGRPFLLSKEGLRLVDIRDKDVAWLPWHVLHLDLFGFMHRRYLEVWYNLLYLIRVTYKSVTYFLSIDFTRLHEEESDFFKVFSKELLQIYCP